MPNAAKTNKDARREERLAINAKGSARLALGIDLIDASSIGVRARMAVDLPIGTLLKIGLPGGPSRHARVAWSREGLTGCEFLAPLDAEELAALFAAPPTAA